MSLKVWLPLNGNLNNHGASGANPVQSTAPTYVNGKIGKAMSTGAFYLPADEVAKFYNNNAMSFAFWIYPSAAGNGCILGQSNMSAGNNRMYTIFQYPDYTSLHLSWQNETSSGTFLSGVWNSVLTASAWNHVAVTYNGSTAIVYVNGNQIGTATGTSARSNFSYNVPVPSLSCRYLNDIRIYDHVLSLKEIKNLAKALIVHYPLDNQNETGKINKFSGDVAAGLVGPGSYTRVKLTNERGYNYKLTRTGTGSSSWPNLGTSSYSFTAGKRYYYSVKVRCNKWSSGSLSLRASRSSNDWVTNSVVVCSPSLADGKWHEYYTSQVVNSTYDRSGTTVTCSPVLEFYCSDQKTSGTVYDMDFDLKDVQVVESDEYVPFIQNEYAGNIVTDTSGFKNNGTNTKVTTTSKDVPQRYSAASYFNGSAYIACGRGGMVTDSITISHWCYSSNWASYINTVMSCTEGGGYSWGKDGSNFNFYMGTGTSSNTYKTITMAALSSISAGWHLITGTYDGYCSKIYLDGVLKATSSAYTTKTPIFYNGSNGLFIGAEAGGNQTTPAGSYSTCIISDFRIYATALSADDIKELYQNSASIDNNGSLYCYDFNET